MPPLVELLKSSDAEEVRCHAISTLRNLAAGSSGSNASLTNSTRRGSVVTAGAAENKEAIMQSGALQAIQSLINEFVGRLEQQQEQQDALSWTVVSEMSACLAVLALSDKMKLKMLETGLLDTLLRLLSPQLRHQVPPEVQGNAAATIGNMATKCPDV